MLATADTEMNAEQKAVMDELAAGTWCRVCSPLITLMSFL